MFLKVFWLIGWLWRVGVGICLDQSFYCVIFVFTLEEYQLFDIFLSQIALVWKYLFIQKGFFPYFFFFLYMGIMKVLNLITSLMKKEIKGSVYRPCMLFPFCWQELAKQKMHKVIGLYIQNFLSQKCHQLSCPYLAKKKKRIKQIICRSSTHIFDALL